MKKILIFVLLIIIIGGVFFYITQIQNKNGINNNVEENKITVESNIIENDILINNVDNTMNPVVVTNKAMIYIGTTTLFNSFEVDVDDTLSVEERAKFLIKQVGDAIGYKITVNQIFSGKGGMTVDLKADSAPFNVTETYIGNGNEKYHMYDINQIVYTIFDSIKETLQKYFGETMDVWFTKEEKQIIIDDVTPTFEIPLYEPYKGSGK